MGRASACAAAIAAVGVAHGVGSGVELAVLAGVGTVEKAVELRKVEESAEETTWGPPNIDCMVAPVESRQGAAADASASGCHCAAAKAGGANPGGNAGPIWLVMSSAGNGNGAGSFAAAHGM